MYIIDYTTPPMSNRVYITEDNYRDICQCTYDTDGNLISVIIPECVTHISRHMFAMQCHLRTVHMLCNIDAIPSSMFRGCTALERVTLPRYLRRIGEMAFIGCITLKHIDLPNTVIAIRNHAFHNSGLVSIHIPSPESYDGDSNNDSDSNIQCIHDNVAYQIGIGCFSNCNKLTHITLPNTLTCISGDLFRGCVSLTSLTIPSSVDTIGDGALIFSGIQSLIVPPSVRYIDHNALSHSMIKSLTILSSRIHINSYAVAYCYYLQCLVLPNTPININKQAFVCSSGVYDSLEEHGYCTDNYIKPRHLYMLY